MQFRHSRSNGCGSTEIDLMIDTESNRFTLHVAAAWMGQPTLARTFTGDAGHLNSEGYVLLRDDDKNQAQFELVYFAAPVQIEPRDEPVDTFLAMRPGSLFNDNRGTFDALLVAAEPGYLGGGNNTSAKLLRC
jgi:hypothetical protein